jgi:beta-lactam-binding protein with PASTA domain
MRNWGRGYERQIGIAALIVAIVALVVGTAGLVEARKKTTKTQPAKTTTTVPTQIAVPDVVGKNAIDASVVLKGKKLTSEVAKAKSATVKKGVVISQKPAAGANVAQNAKVTITVSDGP